MKHRCFFGRIGDRQQGAIVQIVPNLQPHVRIADYVFIPLLAGIGSYVEIAVIHAAPNRHGERQQIRCLRLNLDLFNVVRERPVGDRRSDDRPLEPCTWQLA